MNDPVRAAPVSNGNPGEPPKLPLALIFDYPFLFAWGMTPPASQKPARINEGSITRFAVAREYAFGTNPLRAERQDLQLFRPSWHCGIFADYPDSRRLEPSDLAKKHRVTRVQSLNGLKGKLSALL
jgi:hypothetical protein